MLELKKTICYRLLRRLSQNGDLKRFERFFIYGSPENSKLRFFGLDLINCIKEEVGLNSGEFLNRHRGIKDSYLRKLLHHVKVEIDRFLILERYEENSNDLMLTLIDSYVRIGYPDLAIRTIRLAQKKNLKTPGLDRYLYSYRLAKRAYNLEQERAKNRFEGLRAVKVRFEKFVTAERVALEIQRRNVNTLHSDLKAREAVLPERNSTIDSQSSLGPDHRLYQMVYQFLTCESLDLSIGPKIIELSMKSRGVEINDTEAYNFFQLVINSMVRRSNLGSIEDTALAFRTCLMGVKSEILVQNGKISKGVYRTIISTGVLLLRFKFRFPEQHSIIENLSIRWLKDFNVAFRRRLVGSSEPFYYDLNRVSILFAERKFKAANGIINQILPPSDPSFKLALRWQHLLILAYWQDSQIDMFIKAAIEYLRRNTVHPNSEQILQAVKLLKRIVELKPTKGNNSLLQENIEQLQFSGKWYLGELLASRS